MEDFHPISLVGGIYKIIPKILANTMKLALVISKAQKFKMPSLVGDRSWIQLYLLMNV